MTSTLPVTRWTYAGLFMVALSTLMHEILLTRIFSVTMWYHFAFVAISVAMFGMTVGALVVYLSPRFRNPANVPAQLARLSVSFPLVTVTAFLTQLSIPFIVHPSIVGIYLIVLTYVVVALPFIVSGMIVCLTLTTYAHRVSRLYAADLAGAAVGCVLLVAVLGVTDGPTAVLVIGALAGLGAVAFSMDGGTRRSRPLAVAVTLALGLAAVGHTVLVWKQFPVLRILYAKGSFEARPLYERWNSYSRIRVAGNPAEPQRPYARSMSPTYPADRTVHALQLGIDVNATTEMLGYSGKAEEIDHLRYDITGIGYHVRPRRDVLVVGPGGGRDILTALAFNAESVTGVEINRDILATVNGRFGDFTGHLDRDPRIHFVNDEARSYIARQNRRFDLLQISLIDTWAATAAGAFVLSENSLYTIEAWQMFLNHLTDTGVLSVCRWYPSARPWEAYRSVALASAALRSFGVSDPRRHIAFIRTKPIGETEAIGLGSLLVSRQPFDEADLARMKETVDRLQFETMLAPGTAADPQLAGLAGSDGSASFSAFPVNLRPPTDDSPFFFNMLRLRDFYNLDLLSAGKSTPNMQAVLVLVALLATVIGLSVGCILVPLWLTTDRTVLRGSRSLLAYFACIGLGFMLLETSQMQRLIIVLGHPTYGLSVVLFTLLLSSGLGSHLTSGVGADGVSRAGSRRLLLLLAVLVITGIVTPFVTHASESASTPVRVLVSIALLSPMGVFMGMAFPLGMKVASREAPELTPWLWGVNGALSVCGSVLAIVVALATTISASFWLGCVIYGVAWLAFGYSSRTATAVATR
jgi:spermidine synthase